MTEDVPDPDDEIAVTMPDGRRVTVCGGLGRVDVEPAWALVVGDLEALAMPEPVRRAMYEDVAVIGVPGPYRYALFFGRQEGDLGAAYAEALRLAMHLRQHCEIAGAVEKSRMPKLYVSALQIAITLRQELLDRAASEATASA